MQRFIFLAVLVLLSSRAQSQSIPGNEVAPLAGQQTSFTTFGEEKTRWHYGAEYPRPFFFPFTGPSGAHLTRMGHPGAPNHDHHRSVWFAHHDVNDHNFWGDNTGTQVRQKQWLAYEDGETEAKMAVLIGWFAEDGTEQMEQELITALRPLEDGEYTLEFQTTFRPPGKKDRVELAKTNFGFLAVRVAKSISEFFGDGILTNSDSLVHEKNIFGKPAKWMDYSGPVASGVGNDRKVLTEGITFFDHPENPRYPTHWHVRQDGWMGASFCMNEAYTITKETPLVLRYLLHSHSGKYNSEKAANIAEEFSNRPGFNIVNRPKSHTNYSIERK